MRNYERINPDNIRRFKRELARRHGRLVVVEPGHMSGAIREGGYKGPIIRWDISDVEISLYDNARLGKEGWISTQRGSRKVGREEWQTGWEKDRLYLLRKTEKPTGDYLWDLARSGFQRLSVNGYDLKISPGVQLPVGRSPPNWPGFMLFVPRGKSVRYAFVSGLNEMIRFLNSNKYGPKQPFTKADVRGIADYMMQDLKDSRVSEANKVAGVMADAIVF
jgi:hypothetical protein